MTSVVIPWRSGCPYRERALAWVLGRWAERFPTFDVVLGVHDDGPWCKAAAVADGLSKVADGALILADADVVPGVHLGPALTDQNVAREHQLTAVSLHSQSFRLGIAPVA